MSCFFIFFSSVNSYLYGYESCNVEKNSLREVFHNQNYWLQHPHLTKSALKLFEKIYGNLLSIEQKNLILRGSMEEDFDVSPSLEMNDNPSSSHFEDTSFDKHNLWMLDSERCLNHFYPAISSGTSAISWSISDSRNSFRWEIAIEESSNLKWLMLGHSIHLLEDMGCPPHVRKDMHPKFNKSPYEKLLAKNIQEFGADSNNIISQIDDCYEFDNINAYFVQLSRYTRKNFFSRNTMFKSQIEDFSNTIPPNIREGIDYFYNNSNEEYRLAFKGFLYEWYMNQEIAKYFLNHAFVNEIPEDVLESIKEKAREFTIIEEKVTEDYFKQLEPEIIKYAAGLIKLFVDTIESNEDHPNSPPVVSNITISGIGIGDGGTGDITITYDLEDADNETCSIIVEYQGGSVGTTWTEAGITGEISGITPGANKSFIWRSAAYETGYNADNYKIKIIPNDGTVTGTVGISSAFAINNKVSTTGISYEMGSWSDTGVLLPNAFNFLKQIAVIGNYVYSFGVSKAGVGYSKSIYRAPVSNPTNWEDTGSVLPGVIGDTQLAVIGDYVYLFGGHTSISFDVIYRAPISDPTNWEDTGAVLPGKIGCSHLAVVDNYIYLFGGIDDSFKRSLTLDVIYRASVSDPTSWVNTGSVLPDSLAFSQLAIIGDYIYLFGGTNNNYSSIFTNAIYRASVSDPTSWVNTGSVLPPMSIRSSQLAVIGNYVYLFGGVFEKDYTNIIYRASVSDPTSWEDSSSVLPIYVGDSRIAIIDNYVYLFGGANVTGGSYAIFRAPIRQTIGFSYNYPSLEYMEPWKIKANIP
ncbi:MAG: hypothetical protein ACMUJM_24410 [bacterium]